MPAPSRRQIAFACVCFLVSAPLGARADEPAQARLTINSDVYNVPLGKAFAVRIGGERVTLRIDPQSDRAFDEAGVTFRYPLALEPGEGAGVGEGVTIWTLQGRHAAVMLQRYDGELDPKSLREVLVENLVKQAGAPEPEQQAVKLTGAERAYAGVQVRSTSPASGKAPATDSVQNVFTFANGEGVFALIVQDAHPPGEKDSAEYADAIRLLGESLKTGEPPSP